MLIILVIVHSHFTKGVRNNAPHLPYQITGLFAST